MTLLTAPLVHSSSQQSPLDPDHTNNDITINGSLDLCSDLGVDPEDAILLTIMCELQSLSISVTAKMATC
jgi:hypothetical protein